MNFTIRAPASIMGFTPGQLAMVSLCAAVMTALPFLIAELGPIDGRLFLLTTPGMLIAAGAASCVGAVAMAAVLAPLIGIIWAIIPLWAHGLRLLYGHMIDATNLTSQARGWGWGVWAVIAAMGALQASAWVGIYWARWLHAEHGVPIWLGVGTALTTGLGTATAIVAWLTWLEDRPTRSNHE